MGLGTAVVSQMQQGYGSYMYMYKGFFSNFFVENRCVVAANQIAQLKVPQSKS